MDSERPSFNFSDFLEIARCLHEYGVTHRANREAAYRSAVSRAYFATFGIAVRAALPRGFVPAKRDKHKDHENVRVFYEKTLLMPEVAERLDDLRLARNSCDYHNQVSCIYKVHEDAIDDAQYTINLCGEI
jgi:hypothetical protein